MRCTTWRTLVSPSPGVAVDAGLAEVLRDDDVGGELGPARRDLGAFHLEDDRAVGVRDDALPAFPDDFGQWVT